MPPDGEIYRCEHLCVRLEYDGRLVRVVRTSVPFPDPDAAERAYAPVVVLLDRIGRDGRCIMSDVRLAPGRNDDGFEAAFSRIRKQMFRGFRKSATLVQSKVGLLQVARLIREDRIERLASSDEAELIAYLGLKRT